ncbi:MAG TPA: efflux transporter outer membrane subunit [Polyangiaceae bacterium]|nr:efflux transporter outer membrane subunit [Polyangiaceae bacterium]
MNLAFRSLLVALSLVWTVACAVGPDYERPKVALPLRYRFEPETATAASLADLPWWQVFGDSALCSLVEEALQNNYELLIATARVDGARAQARAAGAQLLPRIGVAGAGSYGNSFQGVAAAGKSYYTASAIGSASWELDVFGRLRRTAEAARAAYAASEEARRGVWVTVLADVGQSYFQLLALDIQRVVAERTVAARAKTLDIFRIRAEGGIGTDLDVARAEADLAGATAVLANLKQQISLNEDMISILLGRSPGPIARTATSAALAPPPVVPAGLPSTLLERRADVREAEANLVAANAQVGVAMANLFPTFSLTGTGGIAATSLSFLQAPNPAGIYSLAGQTNWLAPILQGSSLRYQVEASKANWVAARTTYVQTVMTALKDVADSLATLERLRERRAEEEKQVAALQRAVDLSHTQFEGGTATYLDVISAEQQRFPAELNLAQLQALQLTAYVQLYRSLGGGWWLAR